MARRSRCEIPDAAFFPNDEGVLEYEGICPSCYESPLVMLAGNTLACCWPCRLLWRVVDARTLRPQGGR